MRRLLLFVAVAMAIALVIWFVGCEEKHISEVTHCCLSPEQLIFAIDADSVTFECGDTTYVHGYITALDACREPQSGTHIGLLPSSLDFGYIAFPDTQLRNMTDNDGRVNFVYASFGWATFHVDTIIAHWVYGLEKFPIRFFPQDEPQYLHLDADPDTMYLGGTPADSTLLTVMLCPLPYPGTPEFHYQISAPEGRLRSLGLMDEHGIEHYEWNVNGQGPGNYEILATYGSLSDSVMIVVLP
jgi:hypothetical protein